MASGQGRWNFDWFDSIGYMRYGARSNASEFHDFQNEGFCSAGSVNRVRLVIRIVVIESVSVENYDTKSLFFDKKVDNIELVIL